MGDDRAGLRVAPKPPPAVLAAFGLSGAPVPLAGGRGSSWRVGEAVLKPLDVSETELAWQGRILDSIVCDGFRVARSLRARDGSLVVDGWCAWEAVGGRHEKGRWPEIIAVGERFHAALSGFERPGFIARRTNPWAVGDRVAWGELPADDFADVKHLPRLVAALRPVAAPSQLVHTDLTGNVLFDDRLPPAVIDFSAQWRPTAYASAIVVADALVWEGADESLLDAVAHVEELEQHLLRALIFRAVVARLFGTEDDDAYLPAVELACRLARQ
ncbi:MAG: TIGR02569 family protein [Gaiellaceae bacterium]